MEEDESEYLRREY